jgi:hypothetical protein
VRSDLKELFAGGVSSKTAHGPRIVSAISELKSVKMILIWSTAA